MKRVKLNFVLALVVVVSLFILSAYLHITINSINSDLKEINSSMEEQMQTDEIGDVEGYGLIVNGLSYGTGIFSIGLAFILIIVLIGYAIVLFLFALAARLVFANHGGRLVAYRILMGIEYFLQGVIEVVLVRSLNNNFSLLLLIEAIALLGIIIYSAINTYSSKIVQV